MSRKVKQVIWKNIWAGDWNLLDCSDWGEHYLTTLKVNNKPFLDVVVFIIKDGRSSCWVNEKKLEKSSRELVKIYSDKTKIKQLAARLKIAVDDALSFMQTRVVITKNIYNDYRKVIREYYIPHFYVKYIVDGLPTRKREHFLPILQEARVYAEPVFALTLKYDNRMARQLSKKTKIKPELLLTLTKDELNNFFDTKELPPRSILLRRHK